MTQAPEPLGRRDRVVVLIAAFLGWMFAGVEMSLLPLAADSATTSFLADQQLSESALKQAIGDWFVWYIVAFLLGAAAGGLVFGWLGDRIGRSRAMGTSIVWYSAWTGLSYFSASPLQLLILRFVACAGIGGMWPNGVALVSEAWPNVARPTLAGLIGASANLGIFLLGFVARQVTVTDENWRWLFLVGLIPIVPGIAVFFVVRESPLWLASRQQTPDSKETIPVVEVFRPPFLSRTIIGILLGAIPLLGAWGAGKWILPWTGSVGTAIGNETLKPTTQLFWGLGATLGSLSGGWLASRLGRKLSYGLISIASAGIGTYLFRSMLPAAEPGFYSMIFVLGLITTTYFGWLPLYLPELFSTRVRATGAGVSFNFGRIISAGVILSTTGLVAAYDGDFARIGATTSLIYLCGIVVIAFAPARPDGMEQVPS